MANKKTTSIAFTEAELADKLSTLGAKFVGIICGKYDLYNNADDMASIYALLAKIIFNFNL